MRWTSGTLQSAANFNKLANSSTAAYTVYIQDGQAIAESNMPSGTDYDTGTDAAVINSAITATGDAGGGTVYLKEDNSFDIGATTLNVNKTKVNLIGGGFSTVITTSSDVALITVPRPTSQINGQIIGNMSLIGPGYTNTSAHAFDLNNPFRLTISNIYAIGVRHVFDFADGDYVTISHVESQPITEWGTGSKAIYRGIYMTAGASNGPMTFISDCHFYRPRESGVVIDELETAYFDKVVCAEPGYGDDGGTNGYGFHINKLNSYTSFHGCEADSAHGHAWYIHNASAQHNHLDIVGCFGRGNSTITYGARALHIENMNGVKVKGGEWRSNGAEPVYLSASNGASLTGMEIRGHDTSPAPASFYDGISINSCNGVMVHGCHVYTPYTGTGKSAIYETGSTEVTIDGCTFYDYGGGGVAWASHVNAAHSLVANCPLVNHQTQTDAAWVTPRAIPNTAAELTAGNGTVVDIDNTTRAEYRRYVRLNGSWRYVGLT